MRNPYARVIEELQKKSGLARPCIFRGPFCSFRNTPGDFRRDEAKRTRMGERVPRVGAFGSKD